MISPRYALVAGFTFFLLGSPCRADAPASNPDQKLKSIMVSVDFTNASIEQVFTALTKDSKQLDPAHEGVQFVIQPTASAVAKHITLKLDNVPLKAALQYVCELASLRFKVHEHTVAIMPLSTADDLVTRTFLVEPNFVVQSNISRVLPNRLDAQ